MNPVSLDEPIRTHDDLLAVFFESMKGRDQFRIGPEMEKFGVYAITGEPIPYDGDCGVLRVMRELVAKHGWVPEAEYEGGPLMALRRGTASITLEPGGQFELSGAAVKTVHEVCAESSEHMKELGPISKSLGIRWLGLGFHPFAKRDDLSWVPKLRYGVMREYLPTRGSLALDMMLRTSTVQANYDYIDEVDAMRKMRVALKLSPLTTAMFANSPFYEGAPHGGVTYRGKVWLDVDPDRSGLVPSLWKKGAGFTDYVEWALDVPMFMVKRDGKKVKNTGQTFRSFWKDGFDGVKPTQNDWQTHLNTLFPEVRLKKTIEVRGADSQMTPYVCALPALWTGIFYDDEALAELDELTADFTFTEVQASRREIWRAGLKAPFRGGNLTALATRVVSVAEGGLVRRGLKNAKGQDESIHLARLKELTVTGRSPAHLLLDGLSSGDAFRSAVMERADLSNTPN
jgi:glutamate--cysteine ligase